MDMSIEQHAMLAAQGDDTSLELVVRSVQDKVYGLAMRMLGHPDAARDATQEILIRVVTRLASFAGRSKLSTWVYRIASNYLIDVARKTARESQTFEDVAAVLGQAPNDIASSADHALLVEETFIGCTQGMLLCLDRPHRAAFILGAILELDSAEAASVLAISEPAYRKRLSRARNRLREFLEPRCGVVNPNARCRCAHQVNLNIERGYLRPGALRLATHARSHVREVRELIDAVEVFRRHPAYQGPDIAARLDAILK